MKHLIPTVAARAANLLSAWLGLNSLTKADVGDRESSHGGIAMILGAMAADRTPPPPANVEARIAAYIEAHLASRLKGRETYGCYVCFDSDYGPGRELDALSEACEIGTAWPNKSTISISMYPEGQISIHDKRGYGAEGLTHHLVEGRGWLVSPCNIDRRILPIVLAAVDAGQVDADLIRLDRLSA